MIRIGFIGLGVMGFPMAGHLSKAGFDVTVYNRTGAKAEQWLSTYQGSRALTPAMCAKDKHFVFVCVGNDTDLREVVLGEQGALHAMKQDAILIDHTTASAEIARELSQIAKQAGIGFLDAPVSGGEQGAQQGNLTVMVGGEDQHAHKAQSICRHYAKSFVHIGKAGSGQLAKMVNQICLAGVIQGLAEGLHFAKSAELDVDKVLQAISQGAAQSWQMDNRSQLMLKDQYNHGFAVDWMRKDLDIALKQAQYVGAQLPVTQMVDTFYADVQNMGGQRWDTSSLLKRLDTL
tara:strand:+ start:720 stop:1589 length:870 start_codon:yes stop_codon:yes gene_type:complete